MVHHHDVLGLVAPAVVDEADVARAEGGAAALDLGLDRGPGGPRAGRPALGVVGAQAHPAPPLGGPGRQRHAARVVLLPVAEEVEHVVGVEEAGAQLAVEAAGAEEVPGHEHPAPVVG
ncbi:MAG: hypothetical protein ACK559_06085, partial [bacterium]